MIILQSKLIDVYNIYIDWQAYACILFMKITPFFSIEKTKKSYKDQIINSLILNKKKK